MRQLPAEAACGQVERLGTRGPVAPGEAPSAGFWTRWSCSLVQGQGDMAEWGFIRRTVSQALLLSRCPLAALIWELASPSRSCPLVWCLVKQCQWSDMSKQCACKGYLEHWGPRDIEMMGRGWADHQSKRCCCHPGTEQHHSLHVSWAGSATSPLFQILSCLQSLGRLIFESFWEPDGWRWTLTIKRI